MHRVIKFEWYVHRHRVIEFECIFEIPAQNRGSRFFLIRSKNNVLRVL